MNIKKLLTVNIIVTCAILFASIVIAQTDFGKNCLYMAYDYKKLKDYKKALEYCDKAIDAIRQEKKDVINKNLLSEAHYLKANVFIYMQMDEKDIENELLKALAANPDYDPPEEYSKHPAIIKLLIKAKNRYEQEVQQSFDKALNYFAQGNYCLAMAILEPIATKCRNPELALNILKSCQIKCTDASSSGAVTVPSPQPQTAAPLLQPLQSVSPQPQQVTPVAQQKQFKTIGIFPVIYKDLCKDDYSKKVKAIISQNSICEELKKHGIKIQFDIIDDAEAGKFKADYNLEGFDPFVISMGKLYVEQITMNSILEGVKPEAVIGKLFTSLSAKLKKMCQSKGIDYALFVKMTIPKKKDENSDISIAMNLYSMNNPQKPAVNEKWEHIEILKYVKTKLPKMAKYIERYFCEELL
ncbi:MAG: hypothetical protein Q7J15_05490 [Candidatus Desulfaltia sp.]|nr:hypothetical protein [Candidatus Desulfaltia sp.]